MRRIILAAALILGVSALIGAIGPSVVLRDPRRTEEQTWNRLSSQVVSIYKGLPGKPDSGVRHSVVGAAMLTVTSVDPSERKINVNFRLDVKGGLQGTDPAIMSRAGHTIFAEESSYVIGQYADLEARFSVASATGSSAEISFTMRDLLRQRPQTGSLAVPIDAFPQSFPSDSYKGKLMVHLRLPDELYMADRSDNGDEYPLVFAVADGEQLTQWSTSSGMDLAVDAAGSPVLSPALTDAVVIRRPVIYLLFYYSIALSPALLGFTYLWRWLMNRRRELPVDQSNALELGAALLALLTIREVLVPPDILGVTLMDRILGLQLVFLICALAIGFTNQEHKMDGPPDSSKGSGNPWGRRHLAESAESQPGPRAFQRLSDRRARTR